MRGIFQILSLAAAIVAVPGADLGLGASHAVIPAASAAASVPAAPLRPTAAAPEFDVDLAHDHEHASGLAPGQTASDFQQWLQRSPARRAELAAFQSHLAAAGVESVVPLWQLVRTSSSWRECGAEPF